MSEGIKGIAAALVSFQGEVKSPTKTGVNPHFGSHYVTLDGLVDAIKPVLAKNGLAFMQSCSGDGGLIVVTTLLLHNSGEWLESDPLTIKADKATPQGAGSAITYARRYALSAFLGLASDEDDDASSVEPKGGGADYGNSNSGGKSASKPQGINQRQSASKPQSAGSGIDSDQVGILQVALASIGREIEMVCKGEKVGSLAELSNAQYEKWLKICSKK